MSNAEDRAVVATSTRRAPALIERFTDRRIATHDLARLRAWLASSPDVPDGLWYKDFGSFKICGEGKYPKTFLLRGQVARRKEIEQPVRP